MDFWILNDPNVQVPESKKFVHTPMIHECVKINPRQRQYLLRRMREEVKTGLIHTYYTPWLHPWFGWSDVRDLDDRIVLIFLNVRQDKMTTFMHEMLHALYGNASEGEVYAMEIQLKNTMTGRQWEHVQQTIDLSMSFATPRTERELMKIFLTDAKNAPTLIKRQAEQFKKGKIPKQYLLEAQLNNG